MNNEQTSKTPFSQKGTDQTTSSVAADLKQAASEKYDEAVTEVRAKADGAKSNVAGEVKDFSDVLRRASDELRDGSAQERTLGQISSSLADVSDQIRDKDLGEMVQMASKVARDNPILFLSGAALLGFAASRFAKASRDHTQATANHRQADKTAQENSYVSEGNPNAQPMPSVPS